MNISRMNVQVTASTSDYAREMDKAEKRTRVFTKRVEKSRISLRGWATAMAGAVASAVGLGVLAKRTFDLGAGVAETGSKFNTVFGKEGAKQVNDFLDNFANKAGLTKTEAQALVSTTGAIAQGMGFAQDASATFATQVTKLSADLSSFNNMPTEEVLMAVNSALTGEREQLKRLGIVIKETEVQQMALSMSGKAVAKSLTQQEKATATLALITSRAGVAVGDLERTQNSAANVGKRLGSMFRELMETIAISLMPTFELVLEQLDEMSKSFEDLKEKIISSSTTFANWSAVIGNLMIMIKDYMFAPMQMLFNFIQMFGNLFTMMKGFTLFQDELTAKGFEEMKENFQDAMSAFNKPALSTIEMFKSLGIALGLIEGDVKELTDAVGGGALKMDNELAPSVKDLGDKIKTLDEQLRDLTQTFTKNFIDRITNSLNNSKNAFEGFFTYIRQELTKVMVKWLAFQTLTGLFPHSEFIAGVTGTPTPATLSGSGATNPDGTSIMHPLKSLGLTPQVGGGGRGMTVNQNITLTVSAMDGQDASRFLRDNKGTIAQVISEATRDSTGYRAQLLGGKG
tara:strand:+ start:5503 stop:7215 length:1713 start_codon:yes stop_codon:yes gene_type:complete